MKAWPPKPGLTVITQHQVDAVEHVVDRRFPGVDGLSDTPAFLPSGADRLQRAVEMRAGLGVDGDDVGSRPRRRRRGRGRPARSSGGRRTPLSTCGRIALMTGGPKVMLGTKWPSMTSRWIQSAPAAVDGARPRRRGGEVGRQDRGRDLGRLTVMAGFLAVGVESAAKTRLARMSCGVDGRQGVRRRAGRLRGLEQAVGLPQPRAVERVADRARIGEVRLRASPRDVVGERGARAGASSV